MDVRDLNKVWEIKALKKAGEKEAKDILERIAKQVQPIMRKHKWRVKVFEVLVNIMYLQGTQLSFLSFFFSRLKFPSLCFLLLIMEGLLFFAFSLGFYIYSFLALFFMVV